VAGAICVASESTLEACVATASISCTSVAIVTAEGGYTVRVHSLIM